MELSKIIPKRKVTQKFRWVKHEWLFYKGFRLARERMEMSVQKGCWWCKSKFKDTDMLAIALAEKPANKNVLICQDCAAKIKPPGPKNVP